jgi:hypothetical protein
MCSSSDLIATREWEFRGLRHAALTTRLYAPERESPNEWSCAVEVDGQEAKRYIGRGVDSLQALRNALLMMLSGLLRELARSYSRDSALERIVRAEFEQEWNLMDKLDARESS